MLPQTRASAPHMRNSDPGTGIALSLNSELPPAIYPLLFTIYAFSPTWNLELGTVTGFQKSGI